MAAISSGFTEASILLSPQSHALICSKRSSDSFIVVLDGWVEAFNGALAGAYPA
jgi:hypothetical protein